MIEKKVYHNGEEITEVRSQGGKLLYRKTQAGYEMKCPRTKEICVIKFDQMLFDCLKCFSGIKDEEALLSKSRQIQEVLSKP